MARRRVGTLLLGMIAIASIAAVGCWGGESSAAPLAQLQGRWDLVSVSRGSGKVSPKDIVGWQYEIQKDRLDLLVNGKSDGKPRTVKLDASKAPKWFDASIAIAGGAVVTEFGIFKLEGDTLTWASSPRARPTTFDGKNNSTVQIWKRAKK